MTFLTHSVLVKHVLPQTVQLVVLFIWLLLSKGRMHLLQRPDTEEEKSPAHGGIRTHPLLITRHVLYLSATTTIV